MKSITSLLVVVAITSPSLFLANAQDQTITECNTEDKSTCATTANRTCYNYAESNTHECGNCLADYFEYDNNCYAIDDIGTDRFLLLSELIELFLPEYADLSISTEERAVRLIAATKIISFWDSQVPPVEFKLGLNMETFLTEDEWSGRLGVNPDLGYEDTAGARGKMERFEIDDGRKLEDVPAAVDWEDYTTSVKNQRGCGCCWALSVVTAVESALMINNQTSRNDPLDKNSLSWQQLISCDTENKGCNGGNILQATKYVWEHDNFKNGNFGGIVPYDDYPYSDGRKGKTTTTCKADTESFTPVAYLNFPQVVNGVNDRSSFGERRDRLKAAVAKQPVTSVLRSGCSLLMNYEGGVLTHDAGCECGDVSCIDHAIVITGYNTAASTPYWILRNSWGYSWGEEGYFRIAMNDQGQGWGLFGMLAEAALPSEAYTKLEDLPERPSWWEQSETWEKTLVILLSIIGFCCLCGCLGALWSKRK